eukprot:TRINITY_DN2556_c0_g1_i1.p2 TRINITY_DN2556_c0_g1~~TRINITY_DN2556_c0_g1_i1.p2  ORF type:complete len:75 (-),score=18.92 TRINITY_DN2556_c0_g1_i1:43-267(-)
MFALLAENNPNIIPLVPNLVSVFARALGSKDIPADIQGQMVAFCQSLKRSPADLERILAGLNAEERAKVTAILG